MLAKMIIELEERNLHSNMASLFHGYLMEEIDPSFAQYLHYNQTNPFTSCIIRDKSTNGSYWKITTFNKMAYEMIIVPLTRRSSDRIYLQHKDMEFHIRHVEVEESSLDELFLKAKKRPRIRLLTPTSFKSDGRTHIFPEVETLLRGVIQKINFHSDEMKLEDEKILRELLDKVYLKDYNLRTSMFNMEGIKIKGFLGTMDIGLRGDSVLSELLNFILLSSEYTGMGIKTSLGMGGVEVEFHPRTYK